MRKAPGKRGAKEEVEELRNAVVMMQTISSRHDADEDTGSIGDGHAAQPL